ncbi:DUF3108 domain-containing protein [Hyalangium rubrum]|uniref:DUF3108 domain-containing protein n=1 Tax=Hyalangium rubrum TaxID=3103134 RepID=A0ABU5GVX4_9BACT|nr:DUF3108 domain-containing protein [Hyalangium sp. s54d21]MDY7225236.1 DUF3108 domain-containing protein [Hyalangium sp. s54d21]
MQKRFKGAFVGLLSGMMLSGAALAQEANKAFGPGEQSLYRVQYLGVTAGTAQITVGAPMKQWGQQVWPIVSLAKSDPSLNVWPIKDKFVSYWHSDTQRSLGSDFFADENNKRRRQRIKVEGDGSSAHVVRQKEGAAPSEATHQLPPGTMDLAAATFALRNRGLVEGQEYSYPVFTGSRSFIMRAKVEGKQKLKTPLGEKEVFRLKLQTDFSEKLKTQRDITAYFTTDPSHVPVRVEADFVLGSIVADLIEYKQGRLVALSQAGVDN